MKKTNKYQLYNRQISIFKVLQFIGRRWKFVLLLAMALAVFSGMVRYYKDYRNNMIEYQKAVEKANGINTSQEELIAQLSETQYNEVQRCLYYWKVVIDATDYLENSLLVKADPYSKPVELIYYDKDAEQIENQIWDMKALVMDEEILQEVVDELGWAIDTTYIAELVTVTGEDNRICVKIAADSKENCRQIAEIFESKINGKFGQPTILETTETDLELVDQLAKIYDSKEEATSIVNEYEVSFTNVQKKLSQMMVDEYLGNEEESNSQTTEEPVLRETKLNLSQVLFGFVMGFVGSIVCIGVYYTFSGRIHGEEEICSLFKEAVISNFSISVEAEQYKKQMESIVEKLTLFCEKHQKKSIFLTGSIVNDSLEKIMNEIAANMEKREIAVTYGKNVVYDAQSLSKLEKTEAVVLFEWDEKSLCREIARELNLLEECEVEILGTILIEAK